MAHHLERRLTILPRMRPMSAVGTSLGPSPNSASTRATLRAIPKMGPRLRWPIHLDCGMHGEQVHPGRNGLLHQVGQSEGLGRQHGGIHLKTLVREHLVPIWLPHRINDQGDRFLNVVIDGLIHHYAVIQKNSSPYQPQTNGLAKSTNKTLQKILKKIFNDYHVQIGTRSCTTRYGLTVRAWRY